MPGEELQDTAHAPLHRRRTDESTHARVIPWDLQNVGVTFNTYQNATTRVIIPHALDRADQHRVRAEK